MPLSDKKIYPTEKPNLHPRNRHRERYDFPLLTAAHPALAPFVKPNPYGDASIDFSDPQAVKTLNTALLRHYYGVEAWDIPAGYLCPPIPGRADYIHHIADLLREHNFGSIPTGPKIRCLDIGVGANAVYPIIGRHEYGWSFVGTDTDPVALASAQAILAANPALQAAVECRLQPDAKAIFSGIVQPDEVFDLSICNPPFHASAEEARSGNLRKLNNLSHKRVAKPALNFGGQASELWCEGGEERFLQEMIRESQALPTSCFWYSSLVSKQSNLKKVQKALEAADARAVAVLPMGQGNKTSRVVAWSFLTKAQQKVWKTTRWKKEQ
ncbi:MAG: 23S rRNA (adenine(1618)-N(6))-methyltransferase RlmF [Saprospiraceae bacterium]|nr:23S rRNA (adenine(1618)-N(6))-methyltransferase RlmF [Saprospiraceae bacterium]